MANEERALTILLLVLSFSGIFPFRWKADHLALAVSGSLMMSSLCVASFVLFIIKLVCPTSEFFECVLKGIISTLAALPPSLNLIIFIYNRKVLDSSFRSLLNLYHLLERKAITPPLFTIAVSLFGFLMSLGFAVITAIYNSDVRYIVDDAAWCFLLVYDCGMLLAFSVITEIANRCLSAMNDALLNASKETQYRLIKHFVRLHNQLVDHCREINGCFEFQLLFVLTFDIAVVITNLFNWLSGGFVGYGMYFMVALSLSFSLKSVFIVVGLMACCGTTKKNSEKFFKILSNIALDELSGRKINDESQQSILMHFVIAKKLKFTTFGGLVLDYRLLLSLIATSVTYLMILLQFKDHSGCLSEGHGVNGTRSD